MRTWLWKRLRLEQKFLAAAKTVESPKRSLFQSPRDRRRRWWPWARLVRDDLACAPLKTYVIWHTPRPRGVVTMTTGWHSSYPAATRSPRCSIPTLRGEPHLSSVEGRKLAGRHPRLVFVFSGLGGLWHGAGLCPLHREPIFRTSIERCDAILSRHHWSPGLQRFWPTSRSRHRRRRRGSTGPVHATGRPGRTLGIMGNCPAAIIGDGTG